MTTAGGASPRRSGCKRGGRKSVPMFGNHDLNEPNPFPERNYATREIFVALLRTLFVPLRFSALRLTKSSQEFRQR